MTVAARPTFTGYAMAECAVSGRTAPASLITVLGGRLAEFRLFSPTPQSPGRRPGACFRANAADRGAVAIDSRVCARDQLTRAHPRGLGGGKPGCRAGSAPSASTSYTSAELAAAMLALSSSLASRKPPPRGPQSQFDHPSSLPLPSGRVVEPSGLARAVEPTRCTHRTPRHHG